MPKKKEGYIRHLVTGVRSGRTQEQAMRIAHMAQDYSGVKFEIVFLPDYHELQELREEVRALEEILKGKINP